MKHPVDVHVGKRVRHRRWMCGMTQKQLADKVGIKFQQIQKYETGFNRISASRLWDIAAALQVPVSFFFEDLTKKGEIVTEKDGVPGDILNDKETLELVRSYYGMPENQRSLLFKLVHAMAAPHSVSEVAAPEGFRSRRPQLGTPHPEALPE